MKPKADLNTHRLVQLALFVAIIILMDITQIGYIVKPGMSIALIVIPVTVGAIVLGPAGGAILGTVFGLTSFAKCFGADATGVLLLSLNPIGTFIMTMLPRFLMGWLTGLIFKALKRIDKTKGISYAVASLAGPALNTVLFLSAMIIIFYNTDVVQGMAASFNTKNVLGLVIAVAGINALIEIAVCFIVGTAIAKTIDVFAERSGLKTR